MTWAETWPYTCVRSNKAEHTQASFMVSDLAAVVTELESKGVAFEDYDLENVKTVNHVMERRTKAARLKDPDGVLSYKPKMAQRPQSISLRSTKRMASRAVKSQRTQPEAADAPKIRDVGPKRHAGLVARSGKYGLNCLRPAPSEAGRSAKKCRNQQEHRGQQPHFAQ